MTKRRFFQRIERWLVGVVMAAVAYMMEKAVLRSIKGGRGRPKSPE